MYFTAKWLKYYQYVFQNFPELEPIWRMKIEFSVKSTDGVDLRSAQTQPVLDEVLARALQDRLRSEETILVLRKNGFTNEHHFLASWSDTLPTTNLCYLFYSKGPPSRLSTAVHFASVQKHFKRNKT
jgi:hypothetical protein